MASLASQQYYGHPQNQFWRILQAIWPSSPMNTCVHSYQKRSEWLLARQLGVWDVYASCEREGSLDSRIRQPVMNDFSEVIRRCPALEAIAHNGAESFKHTRHVSAASAGNGRNAENRTASVAASPCVLFYQLPSSSAANAAWSFERKLIHWREIFQKHGLV